MAEMYKTERDVVDADGDAIAAIGQAVFRCHERPGTTRATYLDSLDGRHALDHLDGALIAWDAELERRAA